MKVSSHIERRTARTARFGVLLCILSLATLMAPRAGAVPFKQSDLSAQMPSRAVMNLVIAEAQKQDFPPALALAVAKAESNFKPVAVSSAGAIGVMQIMPRTGRDLYGLTPRELYDPQTNIHTGIDYLASLVEKYDGRRDIALSHYNGGSAVVQKDGALRVIPATRTYVDRVMRLEHEYRSHPKVLAAARDPKGHALKASPGSGKLVMRGEASLVDRVAQSASQNIDCPTPPTVRPVSTFQRLTQGKTSRWQNW